MNKKELGFLAILFVLDILSKQLMEGILVNTKNIPVIPGFFAFTSVHNTGAAWGMLAGRQEVFFIIAILVIGIILYFLFTHEYDTKWERRALLMVLAGTAGNLYDRIVYGYVRDFLDFTIFGYDYPVFNLADCFLCVGFAILAIGIIFNKEEN